MKLYAILQRHDFKDAHTLDRSGTRSLEVGRSMPDDVRRIRSYVLNEHDGSYGTTCIYEARSEKSIRAHAEAAGLPVSDIVPISATLVVREDPLRRGALQVFAAPEPCRRVISERRKTLLKRSWQDELTCSMSVEDTRRIVTGPSALIDAWRLAPRT